MQFVRPKTSDKDFLEKGQNQSYDYSISKIQLSTSFYNILVEYNCSYFITDFQCTQLNGVFFMILTLLAV